MHRRQILALAAAGTATLGGCAPAPIEPSPRHELLSLSERYMDALLDADPFWASSIGLASADQASRVPMGISAAEIDRMDSIRRQTLRALDRIEIGTLGAADRVTAQVLRHHAADGLAKSAYPAHLLAVHHMPDNVPFLMASAEENALSSFASASDHQHHLDRLAAIPAWCDVAIDNFREGARSGIGQPTVVLARMIPMLKAMATSDLKANPFMQPVRRIADSLSDSLSAAARGGLQERYRSVVGDQVCPALAGLVRVLETDMLPRGREAAGMYALPQGLGWYEQCVRSRTTTSMAAADIHGLGLQEVERLQGEMRKMQKVYGRTGNLESFWAWHSQRPEARPFQTESEVIRAYEAIDQKVRPQLGRLFNRLPKAGFAIRAEPEATKASANDHYTPPAHDGSRPGTFYAAIDDPRQYGSALMTTMLLHEGQPGHHSQMALAQELPLTRLQRFWFNDAYGEGWALYAETLGRELGMFEDANAYVGHLSLAMLRAVRLVVDTGLHLGTWSRERCIAYMQANTGFSEAASRSQIDRYIVLPGQALSYAIGRMQLEQLRDSSRAAMGAKFSLAAFHDEVLSSGTLPLSALKAKIERWTSA